MSEIDETNIPAHYFPQGAVLVRYQAAWSADEAEVTLVRDVHKGIGGPAGELVAATLDEAEAALFAAGYLVAGPWSEPGYEGAARWCDLTPFRA